jgi:hypothetical protein
MGHPLIVAVCFVVFLVLLVIFMMCWEKWDFTKKVRAEEQKREIARQLAYFRGLRK